MTKKEFMAEYKSYAVSVGITKNSAACYVTYLNNACKRIPCIKDNMDLIANAVELKKQTMYAVQISDAVAAELDDDDCPDRKQLRNYQSAARLLLAFINGQGWDKGRGAKLRYKFISTQRDLRTKFRNSLKTQDRMSYKFGVFPARIIQKLAAKRKLLIFEKLIDETKFIYNDKGDYLYFADVDRLMIADDNKVYFESRGKLYTLYTEVWENKINKGYTPLLANSNGDLSLDHDKPLVEELGAAFKAKSMPVFIKLSDDIKYFKNTAAKALPKKTAEAVLSAYYSTCYCLNPAEEDAFIKEVQTFFNTLSLTIMQKSYNSSKNKN